MGRNPFEVILRSTSQFYESIWDGDEVSDNDVARRNLHVRWLTLAQDY